IDFKTNRFRAQTGQRSRTAVVASTSTGASNAIESGSQPAQGYLDFESPQPDAAPSAPAFSLAEQIDGTARDYQLQMQAYALALRELLSVRTRSGPGSPSGQPAWGGGSDGIAVVSVQESFNLNSLRATLH